MEAEGRIADGQDVHLAPWEPEKRLREISHEEARFSRGFLSANPLVWFAGIGEHWKPLFHTLGVDIVLRGYEKGFDIPSDLSRVCVVEVDGESGFIGYAHQSEEILAQTVVPDSRGVSQKIVLEYLERRLLSTLARSWVGGEQLNCYYLSSDGGCDVQVAGVIGILLGISEAPCAVWFGVGPRLLEKLDTYWRVTFLQSHLEKADKVLSDHIHNVSVELAELAVPPAMLIDYMRSGTIIDLEIPVSPKVQVRVDGEPWAEGELCQFKGTTAVEITSINPVGRSYPEATTRVRVEAARTELDQESLLEHQQVGAILVTGNQVGARVSLIISGENVAAAVVGEIDGRFGLNILPK